MTATPTTTAQTGALSGDELTDGHWTPRRGILVWIAAPPFRSPKPPAGRIDPDLIACPTCGATVVQPCRTEGGHARREHATRLVSRRCGCGAVIAPRKTYCEPCRARARKQTYRLREIRKPSRERRVS